MQTNLIQKLPARLTKALSSTISRDEAPIISLPGAFKEALIVTDRRVLILKGGFMTGQIFGTNVFQVPISNVTGVEVKYGLLSGYFELSTGGMQNTQKSYWSSDRKTDPAKAPNCVSIRGKQSAAYFREACSVILERLHQRQSPAPIPLAAQVEQEDIFASISRLGELKTAGHISQEEFDRKKQELLARI